MNGLLLSLAAAATIISTIIIIKPPITIIISPDFCSFLMLYCLEILPISSL